MQQPQHMQHVRRQSRFHSSGDSGHMSSASALVAGDASCRSLSATGRLQQRRQQQQRHHQCQGGIEGRVQSASLSPSHTRHRSEMFFQQFLMNNSLADTQQQSTKPSNAEYVRMTDTLFNETIPDEQKTGHPGLGLRPYGQLVKSRQVEQQQPSRFRRAGVQDQSLPWLGRGGGGGGERGSNGVQGAGVAGGQNAGTSASSSSSSNTYLNILASSDMQDEIDDIFG